MNHFNLKYVIYFRTQIADIDVNDVGLTDEIISANSVEQRVPAQNNILVLKECPEHQKFSVRKEYFMPVISDGVGGNAHNEAAPCDRPLFAHVGFLGRLFFRNMDF